MRLIVAIVALAVSACDPGSNTRDGGSCALDVAVGQSGAASFTPVSDGDPVELVLGFQGFRMLTFALRAEGVSADEADVSAYVSITGSDVELGQRTRERVLEPIDGGFLVPQWLVFFNDEAPSAIVGHDAELETIVRAGGCTGSSRLRVRIVDDDGCVDHSIVLDAGARDAAVPDAEVCGAP